MEEPSDAIEVEEAGIEEHQRRARRSGPQVVCRSLVQSRASRWMLPDKSTLTISAGFAEETS